MATSKVKTRQFTGCWTCRYKKRKCDTADFQNKNSCKTCFKNGEKCTFHVKLTWTELNQITLHNNDSITNFQDLVKYNKHLIQLSKGQEPFKKNNITISDRRFMVYKNDHKLINSRSNEEKNYQDIVDKKMNGLLEVLESQLKKPNGSVFVSGPFGAFPSSKTNKRKQKIKVLTLKSGDPGVFQNKHTESLFGTKKRKSTVTQKFERERWDSVHTIIGTSSNENFGHIGKNYQSSLSTKDHNETHTTNYLSDLITFDYTINDILSQPCLHVGSNTMSLILDEINSDSIVVDTLLCDSFINSLNMLPVQSKYSLSALAKSLIAFLPSNRSYLEVQRLNKFLAWCLVSVDVPTKNNIPVFVFESLENFEFDILNSCENRSRINISEIKFINLSFIGLMLREACISNLCQLLMRWFNILIFLTQRLVASAREKVLVQVFDSEISIQAIFVLIEYYICKCSCGNGLKNINDSNLGFCETLIDILLKNSSHLESFSKQNLYLLKESINKELYSRITNASEKLYFALTNCSSNFEAGAIPMSYSESEFLF